MAKYSQEFKLKVVRYSLDAKSSSRKTGVYFNIHESLVRQWVAQFKNHGEESLEPRKTSPKKSYNFKKQVVDSILIDGLSNREAMIKFKLRSHCEVIKWVRLYQENGIDGLKPKPRAQPKLMLKPKIPRVKQPQEDRDKTHEQLLVELAYLRAEVAYLKKRRALIQRQKEQEKAEQQQLQDSYLN